MRIQILISIIILVTNSSCSHEKKHTSKEEIQQIVSEFKNSEFYSFAPYFKANLCTIIIDSTAAITIRSVGRKIKREPMFGRFSEDQIRIAKNTFNFCKKHNIYSIGHYRQFTEIETNLCDSTYTEIKRSNPNYTDPNIGFYHVKNLEKAPYKFSIVIVKKGIKIEEINMLKGKTLIPFQTGVYLYRSFINWEHDKFDLFECNW